MLGIPSTVRKNFSTMDMLVCKTFWGITLLCSVTNGSFVSVLFQFDRHNCLGNNDNTSYQVESKCAVSAFYYDTFGTSKPKIFDVHQASDAVRKEYYVVTAFSRHTLAFQISDKLSALATYPDILSDMKEYTYTIAMLPFFPFMWERDENYLGIDIDIINFLSRKYNFRQALDSTKITLRFKALSNILTGISLSIHQMALGESQMRMGPGLGLSATPSMENQTGLPLALA